MTDNQRLEILKFITEEKSGILSELVEKFGKEIVDEFLSIGFLKSGYNREHKTWSVTNLCSEFYYEVKES